MVNEYILVCQNKGADALSGNEGSEANTSPVDWVSERLYCIDVKTGQFVDQLASEQDYDIVISAAKENIYQGHQVSKGQLKGTMKQLYTVDHILNKSGISGLPPKMRKFIISHYHKHGHSITIVTKYLEIMFHREL